MESVRTCPQCQKPLPPEAPQELCPNCLLLTGLPSASAAPGFGPGGTRVLGPGAVDGAGGGRLPRPGEDFGPYHILRLLGRGGMGEVFEAEHRPSERRVALKVMSHGLTSEADRKRFLREGRLAAGVSHPNVVYIFGSEEIHGSPVIAMELVRSGTLQHRVRQKGPLPVPEAVEATLQIIAGLEAAQTTGVLHRDIKPANCFVGADGTIKVGDFGLSISTIARGESLLTASGSVLGTPAYASPEQLRGEQLDVASDIYSVGATLYDLLTGRPPHDATDFVRLITEVLDKPPAPLEKLRPDVPAGLVKILLRCLAKDRSSRPGSYAALRDALLPFSSTAPSPATLGLRFVAGFVDELFAALPTVALLIWTGRESFQNFACDRTLGALGLVLAVLAWDFLYFALPEGLWGAAVGKTACGLRVVGPSRGPAGWWRAAARTLVLRSIWSVPLLVTIALYSGAAAKARVASQMWMPYDWLWLPMLLLFFSTMRKRNGFAGLHELVSGTRVVARQASTSRPRLISAPAVETTPFSPPGPVRFGPYEAVASFGAVGQGELLLAHDDALRRQVWIHRHPPGTAPVLARRRDLSRATRLRWLNGHRDDAAAWDAYEALDGAPLLRLPPQPWEAVRFWLNDLASEYEAGCRHESLPPALGLDRVWITADHRAVLLDFPGPRVDGGEGGIVPADTKDGFIAFQAFLNRVAERALGTLPERGAPPLPQHAQPFFESVRGGRFESAKVLLGNLLSLLGRPAMVSRRRRLATLALAGSPAILLALVLGATLWFAHRRTTQQWPTQFADGAKLRAELRAYEAFKDRLARTPATEKEGPEAEAALRDIRRAFRIHMAGHHRALIVDSNFWMHPVVAEAITPDQRRIAEEAVADSPNPSRHRLEEADASIHLLRAIIVATDQSLPIWLAMGGLWGLLTIVALLDLGCVLVVGDGLFLRLLGVAVVTRDGRRAGRLRLLWRTALAWSAAVLSALFTYIIWMAWGVSTDSDWTFAAIGVPIGCSLVLAGLVGWSWWKPVRGLQDCLAGTWLVPR